MLASRVDLPTYSTSGSHEIKAGRCHPLAPLLFSSRHFVCLQPNKILKMSDNKGYTYTSSGTNSQVSDSSLPITACFLTHKIYQGNHYCSRDYGSSALNSNSYHYSNTSVLTPISDSKQGQCIEPNIILVTFCFIYSFSICLVTPSVTCAVFAFLSALGSSSTDLLVAPSDGSYYYSNPNGSTYHNNGQGGATYTPPSANGGSKK